ncbi:MAG: hypothetical protein AAGU14_02460 [Eubacteriaceae bacterium]
MQKLKELGYRFLAILVYLIIIIILLIIVFIVIYIIIFLRKLFYAHGDYLLIVSDKLNLSIIGFAMLSYITIKLAEQSKLFEKRIIKADKKIDYDDYSLDNKKLSKSNNFFEKMLKKPLNKILESNLQIKKILKIVKICCLPFAIFLIYYGITNNAVLYADSIKISSPLAPMGIVYSYDDIKNVNVGIKEVGFFDEPYYEIIFNDGVSVNLIKGENDKFEIGDILVETDNKLCDLGIKKNIDKSNYDKYFEETGYEYNNALKEIIY